MRFNRVHWLLHNLPIDFRDKYILRYDYVKHNYLFYRNYRYTLLDCFIIVRTSRKCFRCMYYNKNTGEITYFSCKTSLELSKKMYQKYKKCATNSTKK